MQREVRKLREWPTSGIYRPSPRLRLWVVQRRAVCLSAVPTSDHPCAGEGAIAPNYLLAPARAGVRAPARVVMSMEKCGDAAVDASPQSIKRRVHATTGFRTAGVEHQVVEATHAPISPTKAIKTAGVVPLQFRE